MKRLVVGLTGGVGSGKSTVAAFFRRQGAGVIDADDIGHRVLDLARVRARLVRDWGAGILRGGRIDRERLAAVAFRSQASVRRLNRRVHPEILREIRRELARRRGFVVLDAALLLEAAANRLCDRMIFVEAPRGARVARTAARGWRPADHRRRERFQWPVRLKKRAADFVIDNAGSKSRTRSQVRKILSELRGLLGSWPSRL